MAGRNIHGAVSYVAANRGNIPILRLLLGVLLVGFFLLALMLQVQTSEAFILNGSPVTLATDWGVLSQPLELIQGRIPIDMAKAVMWGGALSWSTWCVWLVRFRSTGGWVAGLRRARLSSLHSTSGPTSSMVAWPVVCGGKWPLLPSPPLLSRFSACWAST